jgi:hypothetical protein
MVKPAADVTTPFFNITVSPSYNEEIPGIVAVYAVDVDVLSTCPNANDAGIGAKLSIKYKSP